MLPQSVTHSSNPGNPFNFQQVGHPRYNVSQQTYTQLNTTHQWHSGLSPHRYMIVEKSNDVVKCYGCGAAFADKYN